MVNHMNYKIKANSKPDTKQSNIWLILIILGLLLLIPSFARIFLGKKFIKIISYISAGLGLLLFLIGIVLFIRRGK